MVCLAALQGDAAFAAASFCKNLPFFGYICTALGSIYIPRSGSKEVLEGALDALEKRAHLVSEHQEYPRSMIYPEGTCSNNTCLLRFRKGAFTSLTPVRPMTIKYSYGMVAPFIDCFNEVGCTTMYLSCLQKVQVKVTLMPDFIPTAYLFESHKG